MFFSHNAVCIIVTGISPKTIYNTYLLTFSLIMLSSDYCEYNNLFITVQIQEQH